MANRTDYLHILDLGDSAAAYDALFACPGLLAEMEHDDLTACEMLDKLAARLFVGPPTRLFDISAVYY